MVESELFVNLGRPALEVIARHGYEKAYGRYDLVFSQGSGAEDFYVLMEGTVHLAMGDAEELCFVVNRRGAVFGWSALFEPYRYCATARCMEPARVLVIPRIAVVEIERDYPRDCVTIYRNLAAIVTQRLCEAYQEVVSEPDLEGAASAAEGPLGLR